MSLENGSNKKRRLSLENHLATESEGSSSSDPNRRVALITGITGQVSSVKYGKLFRFK